VGIMGAMDTMGVVRVGSETIGYSCEGGSIERTEVTILILVVAHDGYHRSVVGGELEGWKENLPMVFLTESGQSLANTTIGRDTSTQSDLTDAGLFDSLLQLVHQDIDNGLLERSTKVILVLFDEIGILLESIAQGIEERGLEAGEGVVEPIDMRLGEFESVGISFVGQAIDDGTSRIAQSHYLGTFIEGFACGIVDGLPDDLHDLVTVDLDDLAVASADEQAKERKGWNLLWDIGFGYEMRHDMSLQVVDINHRDVEGRGQAFCKGKTYEQRAHQPGATGKGDGGEVFRLDAGTSDGFAYDGDDILLMSTAGKFGDNASESLVNGLTGYNVAEHYSVAKNGCRSIVTGGFYTKYYCGHCFSEKMF